MKFRITDDFGEKFEVEEITDDFAENEAIGDDDFVEEKEEIHDEEALSSEEISALKGLAAVADKLMALISTQDSDEEEEIQDSDEEEELTEDEDIEEPLMDEEVEEEEKIIDTEEDEEENKITDSINKIQRKSKRADDSIDKQVEISNAWANNYANFNRNK